MKHIRKMGLNQKLMAVMIITFLTVFLLCFVSFAVIFSHREQNGTREELLDAYRRIDHRVNSYFRETDLASNTVMYRTWVQQLFVYAYGQTAVQIHSTQSNAQSFLSSFASMYGELDCFLVTGIENGDYLKNNNSYMIDLEYRLEDQPWYEELMGNGKIRIFGHNSMFTKKISDRSVTTYYLIKSIYNLNPIGFFVTNIHYDSLKMLSEQLNKGEWLLVTDSDGNLVFSNMPETMISEMKEEVPGTLITDGNSMLYYDQLLNGHWNLWLWKEQVSVLQSIRNNSFMFLLLIPVLLIFSVFFFIFSRYLTKPIVLCTEALHEIRNENYNVQIPNQYNDEIGDMIDGFNDMSANIGHLLDMNRAMYKARLETEFRILQQRINPHFLCNTLEIINGMILCEEDDKALELTGMLGKMYRYDLGGKDTATLDEEISYLKNYLAILSYKFRDLSVEYEIDEETLSCVLPKFVCQPLVENTIRHGFRQKADNCRLYIGVRKEEHSIFICIQDNGKGIRKELLADLREKIGKMREDQTIEVEEHIGMMNTARRLFLFFGHECSFDVQSEEEKGTRIEIRLPEGQI